MTTIDPFNPPAQFPFCPGQNAMFCFRTKHGFCAIALDEIQGFMAVTRAPDANHALGTNVFVKHGDLHYESVESVPDLVARYAMMQKDPISTAPPLAPPTATPQASVAAPGRTSLWK